MAEVSENQQRGWSRVLTNLRRPTANPTAENNVEDALPDPEEEGRRSQKSRLNFLRKKATEKKGEESTNVLQEQAEEKIKKEIAQKLTWRAVNMTMGATVVLVFLTILVWTVQFIGGNLMGSKMIPKLSLGETILWIIGLCVIGTLLNMIILAITLMIEAYEKPGNLLLTAISFLWKNFWSGLVGN